MLLSLDEFSSNHDFKAEAAFDRELGRTVMREADPRLGGGDIHDGDR